MALKPIVGEIKSQDLNDNFSYLDERIVEGAQDPRVDDLIADINAHKAEIAKWVELSRTTAQSIPNATTTRAGFDTLTPYNDADFCELLPDGTVRFLKAGIYEVFAGVGFSSNPTGFRSVIIGDIYSSENRTRAVEGNITLLSTSTLIQVSVNGQTYLGLYQSSGGALDTLTAYTRMRIRKVA